MLARISAPSRTTAALEGSELDQLTEEWWRECDSALDIRWSTLHLSEDGTFLLRNSMLVDSVGSWKVEEFEGDCFVSLGFTHANSGGILTLHEPDPYALPKQETLYALDRLSEKLFKKKCFHSNFYFRRTTD